MGVLSVGYGGSDAGVGRSDRQEPEAPEGRNELISAGPPLLVEHWQLGLGHPLVFYFIGSVECHLECEKGCGVWITCARQGAFQLFFSVKC